MAARQRARVVAIAVILNELEEIEQQKNQKKRKRRWWVRQINIQRLERGFYEFSSGITGR